jgi:hypothetical protein
LLEPVLINTEYDEEGKELPYRIPADCVETHVPAGLYKPKWNGEQWVEGLTIEEIEALKQQHQTQPSEVELLEQENAELKQRLEAAELAIITLMDFM